MSIKEGGCYFVMSDEYEGLQVLTDVIVRIIDTTGIFCVLYDHEGWEWIWSGYIKQEHLLTADQILRLYEDHLIMVDAFERHG